MSVVKRFDNGLGGLVLCCMSHQLVISATGGI